MMLRESFVFPYGSRAFLHVRILNGKCKSVNARTHTRTTHTQRTHSLTHNTAHQISSGDTGFSAAARPHACSQQSLGLRGLQWSRYVVYETFRY